MKKGMQITGKYRVWLLVPGAQPRHTLVYGGDNQRIAFGRADRALHEGRAVAVQTSKYETEVVSNGLTF